MTTFLAAAVIDSWSSSGYLPLAVGRLSALTTGVGDLDRLLDLLGDNDDSLRGEASPLQVLSVPWTMACPRRSQCVEQMILVHAGVPISHDRASFWVRVNEGYDTKCLNGAGGARECDGVGGGGEGAF